MKTSPFIRKIHRVKVDDFVYQVAETIRQLFNKHTPVTEQTLPRQIGPHFQSGRVTLTAWWLSDMAYHAIKNSNDFRSTIPSPAEFLEMGNDFIHYDSAQTQIEMDRLTDDKVKALKLLLGLSEQTFWYQELKMVKEEYSRQVELLEVIPAETTLGLDLDAACKNVSGLTIAEYRMSAYALYVFGVKNIDVSAINVDAELTNLSPYFTQGNISRLIQFFTADYSEYRKSKIEERHFFVKPIIRTTGNRLIISNLYILVRKLADGPFWAIRDFFYKRGSQDFTNKFGEYFEVYVGKILAAYLNDEEYERIQERHDAKRADWFVKLPNYRIIVEQKSSLASIDVKKQFPDMGQLERYIGAASNGLLQLDRTEQEFGDSRVTIKILLLYESFYVDSLLKPEFVKRVEKQLRSLDNIFLMNISEFERFVYCMSYSKQSAEEIIGRKIECEKLTWAEQLGFAQIMKDIPNDFINNKLNHWDKHFKFK